MIVLGSNFSSHPSMDRHCPIWRKGCPIQFDVLFRQFQPIASDAVQAEVQRSVQVVLHSYNMSSPVMVETT